METLFLIGGSGFIGKHLARHLSATYSVSVYDKNIDHDFFSFYPSIRTIELDLVKEHIPFEIASPDYIINLASVVTAERALCLFDELLASNLKILLNLYDRFKEEKKLKLFVQFGSLEEYGAENAPFSEEARESPNSPYGLIKQLTTNTTLMLYRNYGFPSTVVRPANLFGPLQNATKFLPYLVECLKGGQPINVSPCEQKRDFIYIDDFCEAITAILQSYNRCRGEILNIGSGESHSLQSIIEYCKTSLRSASPVNYGALPYRENEVMNLSCSVDKIFRLTGYKFPSVLKQRLADYLNL